MRGCTCREARRTVGNDPHRGGRQALRCRLGARARAGFAEEVASRRRRPAGVRSCGLRSREEAEATQMSCVRRRGWTRFPGGRCARGGPGAGALPLEVGKRAGPGRALPAAGSQLLTCLGRSALRF